MSYRAALLPNRCAVGGHRETGSTSRKAACATEARGNRAVRGDGEGTVALRDPPSEAQTSGEGGAQHNQLQRVSNHE